MGQAKRRGSFEERQKQAVERDAEKNRIAAEKRRLEREAEEARVAAMSEEEQDLYYRRRSRRGSAMALLGMAAMMIPYGMMGPLPRRRRM